METEPQIFDFVKLEKEKAIARFNCFRRIAKLRQFFEVLLVLGFISWSSARAPPLFRASAAYAIQLSTYLFNHHVVFLIGNAIIFSLFLLCRRQSDSFATPSSGDDLYDEYVKHRDAVAAAELADRRDPADRPPPSPTTVEEEKQIVVRVAEADPNPQCDDDMAVAIDNARRQIKRFERTQSEKLKREIRAVPLQRSETQKRRKSVSCGGERFDAAEIERLSSEEFRRKIDAFIHENWSTKKTRNSQFDEYQKYQLLEMA